MKFRVYDEKTKDQEAFLKLTVLDEGVSLIVCDDEGELITGGCILSVSPDGEVLLSPRVSLKTGMKVDSGGYVVVKKHDLW